MYLLSCSRSVFVVNDYQSQLNVLSCKEHDWKIYVFHQNLLFYYPTLIEKVSFKTDSHFLFSGQIVILYSVKQIGYQSSENVVLFYKSMNQKVLGAPAVQNEVYPYAVCCRNFSCS